MKLALSYRIKTHFIWLNLYHLTLIHTYLIRRKINTKKINKSKVIKVIRYFYIFQVRCVINIKMQNKKVERIWRRKKKLFCSLKAHSSKMHDKLFYILYLQYFSHFYVFGWNIIIKVPLTFHRSHVHMHTYLTSQTYIHAL